MPPSFVLRYTQLLHKFRFVVLALWLAAIISGAFFVVKFLNSTTLEFTPPVGTAARTALDEKRIQFPNSSSDMAIVVYLDSNKQETAKEQQLYTLLTDRGLTIADIPSVMWFVDALNAELLDASLTQKFDGVSVAVDVGNFYLLQAANATSLADAMLSRGTPAAGLALVVPLLLHCRFTDVSCRDMAKKIVDLTANLGSKRVLQNASLNTANGAAWSSSSAQANSTAMDNAVATFALLAANNASTLTPEQIDQLTGALSAGVTGMPLLVQTFIDQIQHDMGKMDEIVLPLALFVLAVTVKSLRLLIIPLVSVFSIVIVFATLLGVTQLMPVSSAAPPIVLTLSLACVFDYNLFFLSRFSAEVRAAANVAQRRIEEELKWRKQQQEQEQQAENDAENDPTRMKVDTKRRPSSANMKSNSATRNSNNYYNYYGAAATANTAGAGEDDEDPLAKYGAVDSDDYLYSGYNRHSTAATTQPRTSSASQQQQEGEASDQQADIENSNNNNTNSHHDEYDLTIKELITEKRIVLIVSRVLSTAGSTVLVSALTLTASFISLVFFPTDLIKTLGIACSLTVLASLAIALSLTPTLLMTFRGFFVAAADPLIIRSATIQFASIPRPVMWLLRVFHFEHEDCCSELLLRRNRINSSNNGAKRGENSNDNSGSLPNLRPRNMSPRGADAASSSHPSVVVVGNDSGSVRRSTQQPQPQQQPSSSRRRRSSDDDDDYDDGQDERAAAHAILNAARASQAGSGIASSVFEHDPELTALEIVRLRAEDRERKKQQQEIRAREEADARERQMLMARGRGRGLGQPGTKTAVMADKAVSSSRNFAATAAAAAANDDDHQSENDFDLDIDQKSSSYDRSSSGNKSSSSDSDAPPKHKKKKQEQQKRKPEVNNKGAAAPPPPPAAIPNALLTSSAATGGHRRATATTATAAATTNAGGGGLLDDFVYKDPYAVYESEAAAASGSNSSTSSDSSSDDDDDAQDFFANKQTKKQKKEKVAKQKAVVKEDEEEKQPEKQQQPAVQPKPSQKKAAAQRNFATSSSSSDDEDSKRPTKQQTSTPAPPTSKNQQLSAPAAAAAAPAESAETAAAPALDTARTRAAAAADAIQQQQQQQQQYGTLSDSFNFTLAAAAASAAAEDAADAKKKRKKERQKKRKNGGKWNSSSNNRDSDDETDNNPEEDEDEDNQQQDQGEEERSPLLSQQQRKQGEDIADNDESDDDDEEADHFDEMHRVTEADYANSSFRYLEPLLRWPWNFVTVLIIAGIVGLCTSQAVQLKVEDATSGALARGSEAMEAYQTLQRFFGAGAMMPYRLMFVANNNNSNSNVFSPSFVNFSQRVIHRIATRTATPLHYFRGLYAINGSFVSSSDIQDCLAILSNNKSTGTNDKKCNPDVLLMILDSSIVNTDKTAAVVLMVSPVDPTGPQGTSYYDSLLAAIADVQDQDDAQYANSKNNKSNKVFVLGLGAETIDAMRVVVEHFPLVAALACGAVSIMVGVAFRSVIVPLRCIFSILCTQLFTFGVAVAIYQNGLLNSLNWANVAGHESFLWLSPIVAFTFATGVSLDFDVWIMTHIWELMAMRGLSVQEATIRALCGCSGVITSAAVVMVIAFCGLLFVSSIQMLNELGLMIVVAVLFDAFVCRTLLVPATISLLDRWNFWPGPLSSTAASGNDSASLRRRRRGPGDGVIASTLSEYLRVEAAKEEEAEKRRAREEFDAAVAKNY